MPREGARVGKRATRRRRDHAWPGSRARVDDCEGDRAKADGGCGRGEPAAPATAARPLARLLEEGLCRLLAEGALALDDAQGRLSIIATSSSRR